jgi:hypothetical protein
MKRVTIRTRTGLIYTQRVEAEAYDNLMGLFHAELPLHLVFKGVADTVQIPYHSIEAFETEELNR